VFLDGPSILFVGAREKDRDRVQIIAGKATDPTSGGIGAGVAQDAGPGGHAFAELVGQRFPARPTPANHST
jgi:hypothetical protein